jgi:hypothetical protein
LHFSIANFETEKFQTINATFKQRGGSMKDVTVRQWEMANRVVGFLRENPIAFRKGSAGAELVLQVKDQVEEIQSLTTRQAAEFEQSRANSRARVAARESLSSAVERISRTAQAIAISNPALEARFKSTGRIGDAKLETRARALADCARPHVKEFVAFEMEPEFIERFEAKIQAFVDAIANHKANRAAHAATSQLIDAAMERALTTMDQLDPVIENKLGDNAGLMLKWQNVRHIEKRWVYKKPKETKPTTQTPVAPAA